MLKIESTRTEHKEGYSETKLKIKRSKIVMLNEKELKRNSKLVG